MSGNKGKTPAPCSPETRRDIARDQRPSDQRRRVINEGNNVSPRQPIYQAPLPPPKRK